MNLRKVANKLTSRINPNETATIKVSAGYKTNDNGAQEPIYNELKNVVVQVQPVNGDMLTQAENTNLQGLFRAVYVNNSFYAQRRGREGGGDVFVFDKDPRTSWLVVKDLELWPDWCKVLVKMQVSYK